MKSLIVFSFLLLSLTLNAQENTNKNNFYNSKSISLSFGYGDAQLVRSQTLTGAASNRGKSLNMIALNFNRQIGKKIFLNAGLSYLNHKYTVSSAFNPGVPSVTTAYALNMLSVPVKLQYEFGKYFFLNGGLMGDFDISEDVGQHKYSGIGIGAGVGFQYFLKNNLGIFLNPQLNYHSLIAFKSEPYPQQLLDANVNIGLAYRFK